MKISYTIILYSFFITLTSCHQSSTDVKKEKCSFSELSETKTDRTIHDGSTINVDFTAEINSNLRKLANINSTLNISDSIFMNTTIDKFSTEVNYSSAFLERHNGLVNMLCSIESTIRDDSINTDLKNKLYEEISNYRRRYIELLLTNTEENKTPEVKNNNRSSLLDENRQKNEAKKNSFSFKNRIYTKLLDELTSDEIIFKNSKAVDYLIEIKESGEYVELSNSLYKYNGGHLAVYVNELLCVEYEHLSIPQSLRSGNTKKNLLLGVNKSLISLIDIHTNLIAKDIKNCLL